MHRARVRLVRPLSRAAARSPGGAPVSARRNVASVDEALAMLAPGAVITFADGSQRVIAGATFPGSASVYYSPASGRGALCVVTRHAFREWLITGEVARVDPAP